MTGRQPLSRWDRMNSFSATRLTRAGDGVIGVANGAIDDVARDLSALRLEAGDIPDEWLVVPLREQLPHAFQQNAHRLG